MNYKPNLPSVFIDKDAGFDNSYGDYCDKRDWYVQKRKDYGVADLFLKEIVRAKEETAKILLKKYRISSSVQKFQKDIENKVRIYSEAATDPFADSIITTFEPAFQFSVF
jgi:hypothetical protein